VRDQQDLARRREELDKRQLAAMGKADQATVQLLSRDIGAIDARLDAIAAALAEDFPEYALLAFPEPLPVAETQSLLGPDEALVLFLDLQASGPLPGTAFAWFVTATDARWVELPLGTDALADRVAELRCGLDGAAWDGKGADRCRSLLGRGPAGEGEPLPFSLSRAHGLYQALFGQALDLIEGKHILAVLSGPLSSLPLQVLVTSKPATDMPGAWEAYRDAKWLGRDRAITILPSIASLKLLRHEVRPSGAKEPFIGFGDPALEGNKDCARIEVPASCPGEAPQNAGAAGSAPRGPRRAQAARQTYLRGGLADVNAVRKLCPLPDTAQELRCVSQALNAPPASVITGKAASETALKHAPLGRYKVVHFATHGLLSSESAQLGRGLTEPALVFSPPASPTEEDDGLLTASEAAQLKLDADWAVLSACNTASPASPEAEALSGLARAFLFAGARNLLVSHWPVDSNAAASITALTFKARRDAPDIKPGEALRRAIAGFMADPEQPWNAHPAYWAPFVVIGG
jgi:CHAT domain-containing protein